MNKFSVFISIFLSLLSPIYVLAQEAGGGTEAVYEAQNSASPKPQKSKNAASLLKQQCKERRWREGWDDERKRAFQIETAEFDCKDPVGDSSFLIKREMAAKKAVLSAKVAFIQTINQEMSAEDKSELGVDDAGNDMEAQSSSVAAMAKMPLFGATVIQQTESWDKNTGKYQVAVLLCWSIELEQTARSIVTGEVRRVKPSPKAKNIHDWLDQQDLATMLGPRQYIDEKGDRWFIGITARHYGDELPSTVRRKNKNIAELFAQQMAAFSLFADVESFKTAQTLMETTSQNGQTTDALAESTAEKLTQAFQNKKIRGMQRLIEEEDIVHPITGQQMIVAVYGVNSSYASQALSIEKSNISTAIQANRHQTVERGRDAANANAIENSKNRADDFNKGFTENNSTSNGTVASENNNVVNQEQNGQTASDKTVNGAKKVGTFGAPVLESEEWIECIGAGKNRDEAVAKALIEGVRQFFGAEMSGNESMSSRFSMMESSLGSGFVAQESGSSSITSSTRGFVSGYRIISVSDVKDGVEAKVKAKFVNPRGNGIFALMVYPMDMPMAKRTNIYNVAPKTHMSGIEFGKLVSSSIDKAFADSGKFVVLNLDDIKKVLQNQKLSADMVNIGAASPSEIMRAGKMLTADYIVTTSFGNVEYTAKKGFDKATRKFTDLSRMSLSYDFKIIDVKTGMQCKNGTVSVVLGNEEINTIKASDNEMSDAELADALLKAILLKSVGQFSKESGI